MAPALFSRLLPLRRVSHFRRRARRNRRCPGSNHTGSRRSSSSSSRRRRRRKEAEIKGVILACEAAVAGDIRSLQKLSKWWAIPDSTGNYALHYAVKVQCLTAVQLLTNDASKNCQVDMRDSEGLTPLQWAVIIPDAVPAIISLLLSASADPLARVGDGRSLLDLALLNPLPCLLEICLPAVLAAISGSIIGSVTENAVLANSDAVIDTTASLAFTSRTETNFVALALYDAVRGCLPQHVSLLARSADLDSVCGAFEVCLDLVCINCARAILEACPTAIASVAPSLLLRACMYEELGQFLDDLLPETRYAATISELDFSARDPLSGCPLLHLAVDSGNLKAVQWLLRVVKEPVLKEMCRLYDLQGATPLHLAAHSNHQEIMELILPYSTSLPAVINGGQSQIEKNLPDSASCQKESVVEGSKDHPIHVAAALGHNYACSLLLNAFENPNIYNAEGQTPLHIACTYGRVHLIRLLLAHGADACARTLDTGDTSLHFTGCSASSAPLLIEAGANVNKQNFNGASPLHAAVGHMTVQMLALLLQSPGIIKDIVDNNGDTALHTAVQLVKPAAARYLIMQGVSQSVLNSFGYAPIHLAVKNGLDDFVSILRRSINLFSADHKTPLDIAQDQGDRGTKTVARLLQFGGRPYSEVILDPTPPLRQSFSSTHQSLHMKSLSMPPRRSCAHYSHNRVQTAGSIDLIAGYFFDHGGLDNNREESMAEKKSELILTKEIKSNSQPLNASVNDEQRAYDVSKKTVPEVKSRILGDVVVGIGKAGLHHLYSPLNNVDLRTQTVLEEENQATSVSSRCRRGSRATLDSQRHISDRNYQLLGRNSTSTRLSSFSHLAEREESANPTTSVPEFEPVDASMPLEYHRRSSSSSIRGFFRRLLPRSRQRKQSIERLGSGVGMAGAPNRVSAMDRQSVVANIASWKGSQIISRTVTNAPQNASASSERTARQWHSEATITRQLSLVLVLQDRHPEEPPGVKAAEEPSAENNNQEQPNATATGNMSGPA